MGLRGHWAGHEDSFAVLRARATCEGLFPRGVRDDSSLSAARCCKLIAASLGIFETTR
jgi:hypothetical protein